MAALVAILTGWILTTALAAPASAHAFLLFTSPAADGASPTSPAALTLTFDSPVTVSAGAVRAYGPGRRPVPLGPAAAHATTVTVPVTAALPVGTYTVNWQVTADDGDTVAGSYRFAIGPQTSAHPLTQDAFTSPPAAPGMWPTTVLRWILFAALATGLGGLAGAGLARLRPGMRSRAAPAPWIGPAALAGAIAAAGLALLVAGDGHLLRGLTRPQRALTNGPGTIAALEFAAFVLAGATARLRFRPRWSAGALGAVIVAEAVRGHPQAALPGWGGLLIGVHLAAMAIWLGALVQVLRTALAWRDAPKAARRLIADYARLAIWLLATVVATGVVAALLIVPLPAVLTTAYGRTLLVKLAVVAVAACLALAARRRMRRAPAGRTERWVRGEAGALAGVLAVTALLTALPPPADANRALPFPPPPAGPVVPLGTLAGQVSVFAQASAGQLVVRLFTPGSEDTQAPTSGNAPVKITDTPAKAQRYELTAALADPTGRSKPLRMRRCGTGCFITPVRWLTGTSQITLRPNAPGWASTAVALPVAWPPHPDPAVLRRVVAAMRKTDSFTLYERVTSDTTRGPGTLHRIVLDGSRFMTSEPYGSGNAPITTRADDGSLTIALPAERIQARLVLDERGRIARETLTAPRYLTTRTFAYPDQAP
ncbi:MAG: copper resistance CopC/CopD family protein [Actinoallomurus sp.]